MVGQWATAPCTVMIKGCCCWLPSDFASTDHLLPALSPSASQPIHADVCLQVRAVACRRSHCACGRRWTQWGQWSTGPGCPSTRCTRGWGCPAQSPAPLGWWAGLLWRRSSTNSSPRECACAFCGSLGTPALKKQWLEPETGPRRTAVPATRSADKRSQQLQKCHGTCEQKATERAIRPLLISRCIRKSRFLGQAPCHAMCAQLAWSAARSAHGSHASQHIMCAGWRVQCACLHAPPGLTPPPCCMHAQRRRAALAVTMPQTCIVPYVPAFCICCQHPVQGMASSTSQSSCSCRRPD